MSTDPRPEPLLSFEDALNRLERVVDDLEQGDSGLTKALARYEEGVRLLVRCQAELDRAERSVALLTGVDADGRPLTAPFDATATAGLGDPGEPPTRPRPAETPDVTDPPAPL
jgi:exodeoxyribonuclease VII small subunit